MLDTAQDLREKIDQHYRVRLILDNLPITTYDLAENPESIRPGYEVGYERDGKYFLNNHLMFKILVHKTNGQYTRARENMAEIEAAAVIEVRCTRCSPACLFYCMAAACQQGRRGAQPACKPRCCSVQRCYGRKLLQHWRRHSSQRAGTWGGAGWDYKCLSCKTACIGRQL